MPSLALACRLSAVSMALRRAFPPSQFLPSSLFGPADTGYWYDNQDLSTMFQDTEGTVPVTAVEQPVGLQLDKSRRLELGPELVANGDFSNGTTGWSPSNSAATLTIASGKLRVATDGTSVDAFANQIVNTVAGRTYILSIGAAEAVSGGNIRVRVDGRNILTTTTYGRVRYITAAGATTVSLGSSAGINVSDFDNISIREIRGNHRISPGPTTSRPILRARYNLYINSETFATQNVSVVAGQYRLRFEGTGTITLSGAATGTLSAGTHTITCTTGTLTSTVSGVVTRADLRTQGIPTSLPPYQRITTATDYDTVGFPLYLDTDGADDWMRTAATVDFSGSDKITLVQGLHKRNDTVAIFNEVSADWNTWGSAGSFITVTGDSQPVAGDRYTVGARGSAGASFGGYTIFGTPPDTAIISATHDIASDLSRIWRNGVVGIDGTADKGTGNFRNDFVFFYARNGSSVRFNGRDYGQFAISRLLSDTERNQVESWLNSKMGGIY